MCGLIGVVTRERVGQVGRDPSTLLEEAGNQVLFPLPQLESRLERLRVGVQELFRFESFVRLLEDARQQRSLKSLAGVMSGLAEASDGASARLGEVENQERLASCAIGFRDLAWRLDQDLLPNLSRVQALGAGKAPLSRARAFALWQVNTLLNGLDRLEVRGRDSAGLVIQVTFGSPEELNAFVAACGRSNQGGRSFADREALADLTQGSIRRSGSSDRGMDTLDFVYKVAHEIGEMGQNVAALRLQIASDIHLQEALAVDGVRVSPLAHTRWASNGVISLPNCHPLDNDCLRVSEETPAGHVHRTMAVLNGDIDNFQTLKEQLEREQGVTFSAAITTDAKIIPTWIDRYLAQGMSMEEAFRAAVSDFQGSMAIAVQSSREPGRIYLAHRGSGQSIFIGLTEGGFLFASELYGLVEETAHFIKMDGEKERIPGVPSSNGQLAVLDAGWGGEGAPSIRLSFYDGTPVDNPLRARKTAEITTRDINRAGFEHFMLKEISESVTSIQKTIRGKYQMTGSGVRLAFAEEIIHPSLREALVSGKIRRIYCIGQGTAAVAAQGIAALLQQVLAATEFEIIATKATELSGFMLRSSMSDSLVLAVSQSGTTTDTNRTVDLVRERGATVLAIVNRRNSDLVYKADGVLYTSDGRDIEMSVASTKAFYAQVTAGYLLTLALAQILEAISATALREALASLEQLPGFIGRILQDHSEIRTSAETLAVRHRHWAVVGNGANKVAADEIRIKLSELCYKAIACDYTEDKKHIDLSSEPLILVCAAGLNTSNTNDVVKEVAIFKAHKAHPLVLTVEGEERFSPYAAGILRVPAGAGRLSFVLATVIGHLWGYYAARALDQQAQALRKLRARAVTLHQRLRSRPGGFSPDSLTLAIRSDLSPEIREIEQWLVSGALDSGLTARSAVRLTLMLHAVTGRMAYDDLALELEAMGGSEQSRLFEHFLAALSEAINDLTRPIDAIKHQAKTVTVGISRTEGPSGVLLDALESQGIPLTSLLPSHLDALHALSDLVADVTGSVHYALESLSEAGEPIPGTRIRALRKAGVAAGLTSRADGGAPLIGSKWLITLERRLFAGVGSSDGRTVVMFPLFEKGRLQALQLLHVTFRQDADVARRLTAVRHYRNRYERLVAFVTELNLPWSDEMLAGIPVEHLFEGSPELVARSVKSASAA